jgi:hypothetical protein
MQLLDWYVFINFILKNTFFIFQSGDPVIRIYLAIQVIEDSFSTNRQDVTSEKVLYDTVVSNTIPVLKKIIDDLCFGLFC